MKILIWFGCLFTMSLITTILKWSGITLGGLAAGALAFAAVSIAITLSKMWDNRKKKPKDNNKDDKSNG